MYGADVGHRTGEVDGLCACHGKGAYPLGKTVSLSADVLMG